MTNRVSIKKVASLSRHLRALALFLPLMACATTNAPDNAATANALRLAESFRTAGNLTAAAESYRDGLKNAPDDPVLLRGYGKVLLALDQPAAARDSFLKALESNANDAKTLNGLGVAFDELGDHAAAQERFAAALALDPANRATLNNLAYSFILSGHYTVAIEKLEPLARDKTASPALRQNLALAYGLAGMEADAARVAKMDLSPKQVKANLAYYKHKRAEIAVSTAPYAEVGTYATEALAAAVIEKLKPNLAEAGSTLKPVITPEITAPGQTPRFVVRMMGCAKPDEVQTFCTLLAKKGLPCMVYGR